MHMHARHVKDDVVNINQAIIYGRPMHHGNDGLLFGIAG